MHRISEKKPQKKWHNRAEWGFGDGEWGDREGRE